MRKRIRPEPRQWAFLSTGARGDWAAEKKGIYGMKAGDLIPEISFVLQDGGNHEKV